MIITRKSNLMTEVIFSENMEHRYLLRKEWDTVKPSAMILMINPSSADEYIIDHTTMYVINNILKLDFGSLDIVNIFSKINTKIDSKENINNLIGEENDNIILTVADKVDKIIIAWGKVGDNNKKVQERQKQILFMLDKYKDKFYIIEDIKGGRGYHPLAPQIRSQWMLKTICFPIGEEKHREEIKSDDKDRSRKRTIKSKSS